jgi:hypothetical protein
LAKLFEMSTWERSVEVNALKEQTNFDRSLGSGRQCMLGMFTSSVQTMKCIRVG